jgi:uncharacterized protein (TIRG00374 family)
VDVASAFRGRSARVRTVALRVAVGLVTGGVLTVVFLRLVNAKAVYEHLKHLSIGFAVLCGVAFFGAYVLRAMRWRCLLRPVRVSIFRSVAIYQVAIFVNWLLPVRGGELAMSLMLRRSDGVPVSRSLATVSMDKAMDLLPAVALIALLPFMSLHLSGALWLLLVFALTVIAFTAGVLALAAWRRDQAVALLSRALCALVPGRLQEKIEPFILAFIETLLALLRRPRLLAIACAYTAMAVLLDALVCWLAFMAVREPVALPVVLYGYTFFNLAYILPTPPGQVGSNELVGLLIFSGLLGVNRLAVGAMFVFLHLWTAILMTCSGLACLSAMGLTLRSTLGLAQERAGWEASDPVDRQADQAELEEA